MNRGPVQKTQMNFNQSNYKGTGFDANRPGSAQVPQRPFVSFFIILFST